MSVDVTPTPSDDEMAAILIAYEELWPDETGVMPDDLPRWRFSGRWWSARPRYGGWT